MAASAPDTLRDLFSLSDARAADMTTQQVSSVRAFLDRSLFAFAYFVFGYTDLTPSFHGPVCQFLDNWGKGPDEAPGGSPITGWKRLALTVPRESFKTSLATRANALWQVARSPTHNPTVAIFNAKEDNSSKWVKAIREVIESSHLLHVAYPDLMPPGVGLCCLPHNAESRTKSWKWNNIELQLMRDQIGIPEASITGLGIGGAATGGHWTHLIADDIIGLEDSRSPAMMQAAREWIDAARFLERPAGKGNVLFVYTRWGYDDCYRYLLEKWPDEYLLFHRGALDDEGTPTERSAFPEKWSTADLRRMRENDPYTFACTPANTPITMADWRTKPIEQVRAGDLVVGVDRGQARHTLNPTRVVETYTYDNAEVWEYTLDDGQKVECTPDHKWFTAKGEYAPIGAGTGRNGLGKRLQRIHDTGSCPAPEVAAWVGGFFDGEGSVSGQPTNGDSGGFLTFTQSTRGDNKRVCERLEQSLDRLGFSWKAYDRQRTQAHHADTRLYRILGGRSSKQRFLDWCAPVKDSLILGSMGGSRIIGRAPRVVSRRRLSNRTVHALRTETGNYIAWGCLSSNSQMMSLPRAGRETSFDPTWNKFCGVSTDRPDGDIEFRIPSDMFDPLRHELPPDATGVVERAPQRVLRSQCDGALFWDPAPSEQRDKNRDQRARNGKVCVFRDPWNRDFIPEARGTRMDPLDEMRDAINLAAKWGISKIAVEEVNFSKIYKHLGRYLLEKEFPELAHLIYFLKMKEERSQKDTRILGLIPRWRGGMVYFGPEAGPMLVEAREYPFGRTRDCLDAYAMPDRDKVLSAPLSHGMLMNINRQNRQLSLVGGRDQITGY